MIETAKYVGAPDEIQFKLRKGFSTAFESVKNELDPEVNDYVERVLSSEAPLDQETIGELTFILDIDIDDIIECDVSGSDCLVLLDELHECGYDLVAPCGERPENVEPLILCQTLLILKALDEMEAHFLSSGEK